ncbi:MAG: SpoVG family protein, partial [Sedimentisphaerales bacterium]|nr:SpoVG family protein [Sedimentisphaerales bacterium]
MQISEIRIKLVENRSDRLKAFCSVTFDNQFVIRDLKIIEGAEGYFVAMPSRKLTDRCPKCGSKNHLRAKFCNECGAKLPDEQARRRPNRTKLHADVAHPINSAAREYIQEEIIAAYHKEVELSKHPDYQPVHMETDDDYYDDRSGRASRGRRGDQATAGGPPASTPPPAQEAPPVQPPAEPPKDNPQGSEGFGEGI